MNDLQKAAILALLNRAIKDGCVCSVFSGDYEYSIRDSRDPEAVVEKMGKRKEEWLVLDNNVGGQHVGTVYFVKGVIAGDWASTGAQQDRFTAIVEGEAA